MSYNTKNRFQNEYQIMVADEIAPLAYNFRHELVGLVNHSVRIEGNLVSIRRCHNLNGQLFKDCVLEDVKIVKTCSVVRDLCDWSSLIFDHMHVFVSSDFELDNVPCHVMAKGIMKRYLKFDGTQNIGLHAFTIRVMNV